MPDRGYIRLYRSIFDHPFFRDEPFTERQAWTWLVARAAPKPAVVRSGETVIELGRGEVAASVRALANEWIWSKGKVERFVQMLRAQGLAEADSQSGLTVITVCDYDAYVVEGSADNEEFPTPVRRDRTATERQRRRRVKLASSTRAAAGGTYVYVLSSADGLSKIGVSNNVVSRIASLQTGNARKIALMAQSTGLMREEALSVESFSLSLLEDIRLNGEWLNCAADMVDRVLRMKELPALTRAPFREILR